MTAPGPEDRPLSVTELGMLRMAGQWGMLRDLRRLRLHLCGHFSMPLTDMARLVSAAGGVPVPAERVRASAMLDLSDAVDVVVAGDEAPQWAIESARLQDVPVWREEDLVRQLALTADELLLGSRPDPPRRAS